MSRTAVILVNYNGSEDTRQCVASLSNVEPLPELIVVDNASTESGVEDAVADYPGVELIHSATNVGFGRGNNLGIRRALSETDCEFVFLLNNDATVEPETIRRLEDALDDHPEAGVAAPRIVLSGDAGVLWYGGGEVDWRKGSPRMPGYLGAADSERALTERNVTFASGCAMLIRRTVLEEVGGFDPRLFMYQEDLELCLRVLRGGWSIRYAPAARVLHRAQGSDRQEGEDFTPILSPQNKRLPFYALHVTRGRLLSMYVHARGANALRFAVGFPVFFLYKCLQFTRHRRQDGIQAMIAGVRESVALARQPFVDEVRQEPEGSSEGRMIFVVGNSRSGTTMMGRILGRHPDVFTFGEIHFFEQLWSSADKERRVFQDEAAQLMARLLSIQRRGYLGQGQTGHFYDEAREIVASRCPESPSFAEVFGAFLSYETERNFKKIPCDQTPRNVFYIGEILDLYPEARVVNLVRDPRDVLLSQKRKWRRRFLGARGIPLREALRSWVNYHPFTIGKLWNSSVRAASAFAGDARVHSLRFEDLLADPGGEVRRVCEFAGIDFRQDLLEVPQVGSSSGQDHPERSGIAPERAGGWRAGGLKPAEVYLCQRVTASLMKRCGYTPEPIRPDSLRLSWSLASLPLKLTFALLLNLGRMRNIKETLRRRLS